MTHEGTRFTNKGLVHGKRKIDECIEQVSFLKKAWFFFAHGHNAVLERCIAQGGVGDETLAFLGYFIGLVSDAVLFLEFGSVAPVDTSVMRTCLEWYRTNADGSPRGIRLCQENKQISTMQIETSWCSPASQSPKMWTFFPHL